jgi:ribonuclease BN (tRNA processing enzyme)
MHADHVLDLVPFAGELVQSMLGRRFALYVPAGDGPAALRRLDSAFNRVPGSATRFQAAFDVHEYDADATLRIGGLSFTFAPTAHPQPCYATRVTDGNTAIVYGADGGPSDTVERRAHGVDLLILEATFADDAAAAAASGHMTAPQAGQLAARAGARRLLLTHLLPTEQPDEITELAEAAFGGRAELAVEGYTFEG